MGRPLVSEHPGFWGGPSPAVSARGTRPGPARQPCTDLGPADAGDQLRLSSCSQNPGRTSHQTACAVKSRLSGAGRVESVVRLAGAARRRAATRSRRRRRRRDGSRRARDAAVSARDDLHDRQPQAAAAAAAAGSARVKRSKASAMKPGGKPGPSSRTCARRAARPSRGELDRPVPMAQRVLDQVAQRLLEAAGSPDERRGGRRRRRARGRSRSARRRKRARDAVEQLVAAQRGGRERELAAVGAGDDQQSLGQLGETVGLLAGGPQRLDELVLRAAARAARARSRS